MFSTTTSKVNKPPRQKESAENITAATKTWDVTNKTDTALVVIDAYLSDPSATEELYQRSLKLLATIDGQQLIKAGETRTVSFDEVHTGNNGKAADYTIIIARADNLFPVKVLELPVSDSQQSFPATTVMVSDESMLKQAETFQQTIIAFPASQMATAYANVLLDPNEEKIATFFKAYPKYGAITLDAVTAVQTYYNHYGFVWAGYKTDQTYYLYTSDGTKKKSLGYISINNHIVAPLTNLDAPPGFTAIYTDANHRNTALYYSNGQFSDDVHSSSPKICLQGLFILKSQLTSRNTDNKLTTVVYGAVNDEEVFGYYETGQPISVASPGNEPGQFSTSVTSVPPEISALLNPQGVWGWMKLAGLIAGALAAIGVLVVTARFIIKNINKGPSPTPAEINRKNREKALDALNRMDPQLKRRLIIPDDINQALTDLAKSATDNLLIDNKLKMQEILHNQLEMHQKLFRYGSTDPLQIVYANLYADADILEHNSAELAGQMDGLVGNIKTNAKILNDRTTSLGSRLLEVDLKTIADARKIAEGLTDRVVKNEEIREDISEDKIPEIIED